MLEQYHKWHSQFLDKDLEMLVFGNSGLPIVVFPPAYGRYYSAKDFGLIYSVHKLIDEGKIKIYCPEGFDSQSYCNYSIEPAERVKLNNLYEKTILNDVIDFAAFETNTKKVGLAGCDFGAYQAFNIAMKHPDKASSIISMGGFFDIRRFIFGFFDDNAYYNNPTDYLPNLTDEWYLEKIRNMKIFLGVGDWDQYLGENRRMSDILNALKVEHTLDIRQYTGHDWKFWCEMFPCYVSALVKE